MTMNETQSEEKSGFFPSNRIIHNAEKEIEGLPKMKTSKNVSLVSPETPSLNFNVGPARRAIEHLISQSDLQDIRNQNIVNKEEGVSIAEKFKNLNNKVISAGKLVTKLKTHHIGKQLHDCLLQKKKEQEDLANTKLTEMQNKENRIRNDAVALIVTKGNVDNLEAWSSKDLWMLLRSIKSKTTKKSTTKAGMIDQIREALDTVNGKSILYEGLFTKKQQEKQQESSRKPFLAEIESEGKEEQLDSMVQITVDFLCFSVLQSAPGPCTNSKGQSGSTDFEFK